MSMTRRQAAQTIAGGLALPNFVRAARAADLPTLKVAIQPIEPSCQPYYAQVNGYTDKAGINVDVSTVMTSPVILQALLSGTYDIGSATVTTLALAHIKGLPIVVVGPQAVVERGVVQGGIVTAAKRAGAQRQDVRRFRPRHDRGIRAARVGRQERRRLVDDEV
jgi:NitT/TauT family transport system substrate-binding protein